MWKGKLSSHRISVTDTNFGGRCSTSGIVNLHTFVTIVVVLLTVHPNSLGIRALIKIFCLHCFPRNNILGSILFNLYDTVVFPANLIQYFSLQ